MGHKYKVNKNKRKRKGPQTLYITVLKIDETNNDLEIVGLLTDRVSSVSLSENNYLNLILLVITDNTKIRYVVTSLPLTTCLNSNIFEEIRSPEQNERTQKGPLNECKNPKVHRKSGITNSHSNYKVGT